MNLIVNVDLDWGIGKDNDLLFHLPADLRQFKRLTTGRIIVLGRKTLDTFPGQKPLRNRVNIVLTRDKNRVLSDAIICHDHQALKEELLHHPGNSVFVVGGESIYRQLLPFCNRAYVTRVYQRMNADAFFPNLDSMPNWKKIASGPVLTDYSRSDENKTVIPFQYLLYQQIQSKRFGQDIPAHED